MFTARVVTDKFIAYTLLIGVMLWVAVAIPLRMLFDISWDLLLLGLPLNVAVLFVWTYFYYFKSDLSPSAFITQAILTIVIYSPYCVHMDLIVQGPGAEQPLNFWFAVAVICMGTVLGYINAWLRSPTLDDQKKISASWWTVDIDLQEHKYLSSSGLRRLLPLMFLFGVVALLLFAPYLNEGLFADKQLRLQLLLRVAGMGMTLIIYTLCAVTVGEAIHLIQIERHLGKGPLGVYDFDLRLKWRHDYVKYHMPAPIRALNLRLFNQHIEAYENYQREQVGVVKGSPTR